MKKIILVGVLCVLPMKAHAAITMGIGTQKCSAFNKMNIHDQYLVFHWVQGYMSAMNDISMVESNKYVELNDENFNYQAQLGMLRSLCENNPNETIPDEILSLVTNMVKMGLQRTVKP